VSDDRNIQNLALVGFMGTGKSTLGRLAAEHLRFEFVDTDAWIEAQTGQSVSDIFSRQGETAFRQYEKQAVAALGLQRGLVIATGGGLVLDPANLAGLKAHSLVIWLCASPGVIWARVKDQPHRPLLQVADPQARIREMLAARSPAYRQADVLLDSGLRPPREVAQQIAHQFHLARKK
jgi:shikimate kinase